MSAPAPSPTRDPFVVYRSVNRDGETSALEPRSLARLREALPKEIHSRPRVFIAHENVADYDHVHASVAGQVLQLLTGVVESRLCGLGEVIFRDPVAERGLELRGQ